PNTSYVWKVQASCAGGTTSTYSGEGSFNSGFAPVTSPGARSLALQPGLKSRMLAPILIHYKSYPNTSYVWKVQASCAGGTTSTYSGEGSFNSGFAP
ncbi:hypothetical protein, partial [Chryseobacterium sp. CH1]|uniref:hypothetical protein n=1 Tax=Chryseobacterium sp. CH1 TaxID=713551 RepID=UPI0010286865